MLSGVFQRIFSCLKVCRPNVEPCLKRREKDALLKTTPPKDLEKSPKGSFKIISSGSAYLTRGNTGGLISCIPWWFFGCNRVYPSKDLVCCFTQPLYHPQTNYYSAMADIWLRNITYDQSNMLDSHIYNKTLLSVLDILQICYNPSDPVKSCAKGSE